MSDWKMNKCVSLLYHHFLFTAGYSLLNDAQTHFLHGHLQLVSIFIRVLCATNQCMSLEQLNGYPPPSRQEPAVSLRE